MQLKLDRVGRYLPNRWLLSNISFDLTPGLTVLAGPNGAGKSTLAQLIALLWPPDAGRIAFDGLDPWCLPETQRARIKQRIGYLPQSLLLPQRLRVSAVCHYFAALWGVEEKAIFRVIQVWGLVSLYHQRVSRLSVGERQRLLLAVSELAQPSLWVLDEPFRALDAEGTHQLVGRLATVTDGPYPVTVLLITHLFGPIERLWDKLLLLEHGHLAGQLTAADTGLTLTEAYRRLHIDRR